MGTLIHMNNSQNYSSDIAESPSLIELLNWNNDDVVTLLDDISLNNINDQDPKPTNNIQSVWTNVFCLLLLLVLLFYMFMCLMDNLCL